MSGFGSFCEGLPSWSSSQHGGDITHGHTAPLEDDNYNSSNPDGQEVNAEPVDWQGLSELQTHELQGHIYTNSLPSTVSPAMDPLAMDSAITSDHLAAMNQLASTVSDYGWVSANDFTEIILSNARHSKGLCLPRSLPTSGLICLVEMISRRRSWPQLARDTTHTQTSNPHPKAIPRSNSAIPRSTTPCTRWRLLALRRTLE